MWERILAASGACVRAILAFLHWASLWARYGYFLRFSLMLWLFAPGLCALNSMSSTLTSGIVTPEAWQQYFCVGFFQVSSAFAALVIARVVIINGPERWDRGYNPQNDARPPLLTTLLDNETERHENTALLIAQTPTALVFLYLTINGVGQNVNPWEICPGFIGGAFLSACFWWLANAWFYLRYVAPPPQPPPAEPPTRLRFGQNAARTILYPRWCFRLNRIGTLLPGRPTIEQGHTMIPHITLGAPGRWLAGQPGFGVSNAQTHYLYEAHAFATIALAMFSLLFVVIWPLTAPVPAPTLSLVVIVFLTLVGLCAIALFVTARPAEGGRLKGIKVGLTLGILVFLAAVVVLYKSPSPERFPIFATLLILMIAVFYVLGGIAFFLDRYRVPVLTSILVAMIVPRMLHVDRTIYWGPGPQAKNAQDDIGLHLGNGQEEHYLSTTITDGPAAPVQTPRQILSDRLSADDPKPLIVVTATGGGLHASAWTAAILARLEEKLGKSFHQHLLLMSTVSGGSVGAMTYLRELHDQTLDGKDSRIALARMQSVAECSSLESVGWGLVYYDLPKAFIPVFPYFIAPSPGMNGQNRGDLWSSPVMKDRTWALRKAFERNLKNSYCNWIWARDGNNDPGLQNGMKRNSPESRNDFTLRNLAANAKFPAFTMNTTTVEHGERFLLANYKVPHRQLTGEPEYQARSFLTTFTFPPPAGETKPVPEPEPDLPLATAAQMSATFPYVSSAARVPMTVDNNINSVHFVDGGYYDNDGTVSAIEFIRYALGPPEDGREKSNDSRADPVALIGKGHPLRILLIEIRNSGDIDPTDPNTRGDESDGNSPWNVLSQLGGPLLAFWQAGHESVTGRNRNALGLMEQALADKLELHRVVFADGNSLNVAGTDPLNWSLTPKQRAEVRTSAVALPLQEEETKCWFTKWDEMWKNAQAKNPKPVGVCDCFAPGLAAPSKQP